MLPSLLPIGDSEGCAVQSTVAPAQRRLYFLPEPQALGSFRPPLRPTTQGSSPVEGVKGVERAGDSGMANKRQRKLRHGG
jgi:hypothetical protein